MNRTTSRAGVVSWDFVSIQSDPEVVVTIVDLDVPVIGYTGMGSILDPDRGEPTQNNPGSLRQSQYI
jgi:hypothetical protein